MSTSTSGNITQLGFPLYVKKISNGYILGSARYESEATEEYFCESIADVGARVTALLVKYEMEGGT